MYLMLCIRRGLEMKQRIGKEREGGEEVGRQGKEMKERRGKRRKAKERRRTKGK